MGPIFRGNFCWLHVCHETERGGVLDSLSLNTHTPSIPSCPRCEHTHVAIKNVWLVPVQITHKYWGLFCKVLVKIWKWLLAWVILIRRDYGSNRSDHLICRHLSSRLFPFVICRCIVKLKVKEEIYWSGSQQNKNDVTQ